MVRRQGFGGVGRAAGGANGKKGVDRADWPICVKIRNQAAREVGRALSNQRGIAASFRRRGEFWRRASNFSLRIIRHAPSPRMTSRSAHSAMRNRDQGLCV